MGLERAAALFVARSPPAAVALHLTLFLAQFSGTRLGPPMDNPNFREVHYILYFGLERCKRFKKKQVGIRLRTTLRATLR